jgi:predicted ATPase
MISLTFLQAYRSIRNLPAVILPDFAVITGINGSGKSHLLEAISNGAVSVEGISVPLRPLGSKPRGNVKDADVQLFTWNTLVPAAASTVDPIQLERERTTFVTKLAGQFSQLGRVFLNQVARWKLSYLPLDDLNALLALSQTEFEALQKKAGRSDNHWPPFAQQKAALEQGCHAAAGLHSATYKLLVSQAEQLKTHVSTLTSDQIDTTIPLTWTTVDIFQQNFSQIFARYHRAWDENRYKDYSNQQYKERHAILGEEEFESKFGEPPWDFVNRLLTEAHLNFEINRPLGRADRPFEARLRDKETGAEVSFQDLSSGEKIIMSFALCLYNANDKTRQVKYPKLLLFDEVDAPLHPSMTRDLVRVIREVLVKEKGVKVLLATHSPATVAFAPDESLFRLEKHPRGLHKSSREDAIQILTSGYISVTDNTKFVITEAKQDRLFYTAIARKLVERTLLKSNPNLVFIQASDRKDRAGGGHNQVEQWASKLPEAGLTQILGLIDRDLKNTSSATIKVLSRFSVENYLCDPLILYAQLMHEGQHLKIHDAGIKNGNYYDLRNLPNNSLQRIVDRVSETIEQYSGQVRLVPGTFQVRYISGKTITAPLWLRDVRGHELVAAVREAFKSAIGPGFILTANDCEDLLKMMSDRLPEFIPEDLAQVLADLQAA